MQSEGLWTVCSMRQWTQCCFMDSHPCCIIYHWNWLKISSGEFFIWKLHSFSEPILVAFPLYRNPSHTMKKFSYYCFKRIFIVVQSAIPNTLCCLFLESTVQEFTSVYHMQMVLGMFKDESSQWKIFTNSFFLCIGYLCVGIEHGVGGGWSHSTTHVSHHASMQIHGLMIINV